MAKAKDHSLVKKTSNYREGDFEKMGELFPDKSPSVAIRDLISAFVDKHYASVKSDPIDVQTDL